MAIMKLHYITQYLANTKTLGIYFTSDCRATLESFLHFPIPSQIMSMSDANWGPQDASTSSSIKDLALFVSRSMSAYDKDNSKDNPSQSNDSEDSEDEDDADPRSDELLEEAEKTKDEGVHHEVAVQGCIAHGNVGQLVVSVYCICILFCIP
jgi:hypothetical protein